MCIILFFKCKSDWLLIWPVECISNMANDKSATVYLKYSHLSLKRRLRNILVVSQLKIISEEMFESQLNNSQSTCWKGEDYKVIKITILSTKNTKLRVESDIILYEPVSCLQPPPLSEIYNLIYIFSTLLQTVSQLLAKLIQKNYVKHKCRIYWSKFWQNFVILGSKIASYLKEKRKSEICFQ